MARKALRSRPGLAGKERWRAMCLVAGWGGGGQGATRQPGGHTWDTPLPGLRSQTTVQLDGERRGGPRAPSVSSGSSACLGGERRSHPAPVAFPVGIQVTGLCGQMTPVRGGCAGGCKSPPAVTRCWPCSRARECLHRTGVVQDEERSSGIWGRTAHVIPLLSGAGQAWGHGVPEGEPLPFGPSRLWSWAAVS